MLRGAPVALAAVVLGCGGPGDPAQRPSLASGEATYTESVAAILFEHCAGCHRPGSVAPFPLLEYADARRRARQIGEVIASGYMPPWLPEPGFGDFRGARRLSPDEVASIERWIAAGSPEGPPEALPEVPVQSSGWLLGDPDLVVEMPVAFELGAEGEDVFRNFRAALDVAPGTRVRALQFRPGNARVVHHAAVLADASGTARRLDGRDGLPGYPEMIGGTAPGGHFVGWTPGRGAVELEDGMSWEVEEGTDLVFQLHLLPSGRPESVRASVGLYFTDEAPRAVPASLHLLTTELDIPAGAESFRAVDEMVVPVDVDVFSAYPHAHFVGREVKAEAMLPDGSTEPLLWIRDWDFNWQDEYRYTEPVRLPRGTTVRLEIVYDNSSGNPRNPHDPPRRIAWGPSSYDEMGDLWLKSVPVDPGDLEALRLFLAERDRERYRRGYGLRVAIDPDDGEAHTRLGIGAVQSGDLALGLQHLDRALETASDAWEVRYNRATALAGLGRRAQAVGEYRRALALSPGDSKTHNALGGLLLLEGDADGAVREYRAALESRPRNPDLLVNLALAQARNSDVAAAESTYRRALAIDEGNANVHLNYGTLLGATARPAQAVDHFRRALEIEPAHPLASKNLALVLSSSGRQAEAEGVLRSSIGEHPRDADLHHFLGLVLLRQERAPAASKELHEAERLEPGSAVIQTDLGLALLLAGDASAALDSLERALANGGDSAELRFRRALAARNLGDPAGARREILEALRLDPDHEDSRRLSAELDGACC